MKYPQQDNKAKRESQAAAVEKYIKNQQNRYRICHSLPIIITSGWDVAPVCTRPNTCFLEPTRVPIRNGISISSAVRHLGFSKIQILTADMVKRAILHHRAKFRDDRLNCRDLSNFFTKWRPFAILDSSDAYGTIHKEYLVFIVVQNYVVIDAVVPII